jgi:MFS family permease
MNPTPPEEHLDDGVNIENPNGLVASQASVQHPNPLNYAICLIDAFSFNFGMAFWSLTTIVPLFLRQLHASNSVIGLLPALVALGYSLPGLFVAKRISRLRVAKWWLFWVAVGERIPLLAIAVLIPSLGVKNQGLTLCLFMLAFAMHSVMLGLNQPAYWSFVGKTIPAKVRGRVYGWAGAIGGVAGLTVAPITRHFLTQSGIANLTGFASCFTLGIVVLIIGILPFAAIDEPVASPNIAADPHEGHFLQDGLKAWRAEKAFRILVMSQFAGAAAMLAQPFYVLQYSHSFTLTGAIVAQFTAISVVSAALSSLVWGYVADHFGNKIVLIFGAMLGFVGPALVALNPPAAAYNAVFMMLAFSGSALMLAGYNSVIEYAGASSAVPFYTTVFNTILTPIRVLGPIVGGLLADTVGYNIVFILAAVLGLVAVFATTRIVDPRTRGLSGLSQ